jgi:broad specificity phosphatase PhoE
MGTLYLIRHGQASFGAEDYDNLSELGHRQSVRLGEYLAGKGLKFDALLVGTLKRHAQTLAGIQEGMKTSSKALLWPGLNEYDSHAVISAIQPEPLQKPDTPELYRNHFRVLRNALTHWMNGKSQPLGMPSYPDFQKGVTSALDHVSAQHGARNDANVLIVSSGGPISTAVGHILGTMPEMTIELNLRIRNTSITEFNFNPKRHTLVTYNTLPHLDHADYANWVTYS